MGNINEIGDSKVFQHLNTLISVAANGSYLKQVLTIYLILFVVGTGYMDPSWFGFLYAFTQLFIHSHHYRFADASFIWVYTI